MSSGGGITRSAGEPSRKRRSNGNAGPSVAGTPSSRPNKPSVSGTAGTPSGPNNAGRLNSAGGPRAEPETGGRASRTGEWRVCGTWTPSQSTSVCSCCCRWPWSQACAWSRYSLPMPGRNPPGYNLRRPCSTWRGRRSGRWSCWWRSSLRNPLVTFHHAESLKRFCRMTPSACCGPETSTWSTLTLSGTPHLLPTSHTFLLFTPAWTSPPWPLHAALGTSVCSGQLIPLLTVRVCLGFGVQLRVPLRGTGVVSLVPCASGCPRMPRFSPVRFWRGPRSPIPGQPDALPCRIDEMNAAAGRARHGAPAGFAALETLRRKSSANVRTGPDRAASRSIRRARRRHSMPSSSTSKSRVASPGIAGGRPAAP